MERGVIFGVCFGILTLLMVNGVYAITTSLKDNYQSGETIIFSLSGNILEPIFPEQVEFKRGHIKLPLEYDIKKLGENYYVWTNAPFAENGTNYTLLIKDIVSTVNGKTEKIDYEKNFSVSGNLIDYSIKPGIIFAKSDFDIAVQLNEDIEKSIEIGLFNESRILNPGLNTVRFYLEDFSGAKLNIIKIGKYNVPAYVIGKREAGLSNLSNRSVIGNLTGDNESDKEPAEETREVDYYCYELPGKICSANEICKNGQNVQALDGKCCVSGTCAVEEKESGTGTIIGIVIILFVGAASVYVWYKYKKTGSINIFARKVKDAEVRARGLP